MTIRARKTIKFGPFRVNVTTRGASVSATEGPVTVNSRRRVRVNLPGPFFWTGRPRRRRSR
jgi:hypothetical protein